jgi:hypothetical protein
MPAQKVDGAVRTEESSPGGHAGHSAKKGPTARDLTNRRLVRGEYETGELAMLTYVSTVGSKIVLAGRKAAISHGAIMT